MKLLLFIGMINATQLPAMDLLDAIAEVESGSNDRAVGKAGEVSRYQILPSTWKQYYPYTTYDGLNTATFVARQHLNHLKRLFYQDCGLQAEPADLAAMWQVGFEGYKRKKFNLHRLSKAQQDRVKRILNLTKAQ